MDQNTRNTLRNVVTQCRRLLEDSVAQVLQGQFGIFAVGRKDEVQIEPDARMSYLSEEDRAYRQDLLDHYEHIKALGYRAKDALAQLIREVAFTHLNRFCAYRMMESRGLIRESVSKGLKSQGFLFYLADHEEDERRYNTGQQDLAYRHYLNWLGGTLSEEIGVLFAPTDPANRLYPPQRVIDEVLGLLNDPELAGIWSEDEAIGWVYQYFTPKELRDQARKESQAPRNSYELAFRNQFFTPRYVVEFLTDNTLGRIWYEMRRGDTRLKDQCLYMVRRPTEVFLKDGESEPKDAATATDDLSQEDLLKLPVYVPFRAKKDPRELRILDPACGSGHFLLYCFDLLLTIYEEAYSDPDLGPALKKDYPSLDDLRRDVPRLILAHNLHGIDIDLRASQIAALALWLRCQRAYQEMRLKQDRPKITRSNIVCAEPMPGEAGMLKEFVQQLEPKVLGQVVEVVFQKMKLAGEVGSLLKIEEEIREAVAAAKKQYARETTPATDRKGAPLLFTEAEMGRLATAPRQEPLFDVTDITDATFFEHAERRVVETLRAFAASAQQPQWLQRRLFTDDAVRGFAFVDNCEHRYDVILMNPPFGEGTKTSDRAINDAYPTSKVDLYAAFVERGAHLLVPSGLLGAITSRTGFFLSSFHDWRTDLLLKQVPPTLLLDLGVGVLDTAMVETAAYCLEKKASPAAAVFMDGTKAADKESFLSHAVRGVCSGKITTGVWITAADTFKALPGSPFAYWVGHEIRRLFKTFPAFESDWCKVRQGLITADDFRFLRLWWEVPTNSIATGHDAAQVRLATAGPGKWVPVSKGGEFSPYFPDLHLVVNWANDGEEIKTYCDPKSGRVASRAQNTGFYFRSGLTYPFRTQKGFNSRLLPSGCIFTLQGIGILIDGVEAAYAMCALSNSNVFRGLLELLTSFNAYQVGYVQQVPCPLGRDDQAIDSLASAAKQSWNTEWQQHRNDETCWLFSPTCEFVFPLRSLTDMVSHETEHRKEAAAKLVSLQKVIDDECVRLYGLSSEHAVELTNRMVLLPEDGSGTLPDSSADASNESESDTSAATDLAPRLISFWFGAAIGRWLSGTQDGFDEGGGCDPLAPLPTGPKCLRIADNVADAGILPDDPSHSSDVVAMIRLHGERLWGIKATDWEQQVLTACGVKNLRDYFRKPGKGGFWDDHISRYSKSRRRAPIYWLLQSSKKNYAIWLYYHRLDKDILFKALVNYVEPKIRLENDRLDSLRSQKASGGAGKGAKKLDKEIEKQEEFLSELRDFEEKLRRAADLHLMPDLNDGVVLNIAPLHELVPWKEAKKYWEELLEGKYEWSSIGKQLREKGLVK